MANLLPKVRITSITNLNDSNLSNRMTIVCENAMKKDQLPEKKTAKTTKTTKAAAASKTAETAAETAAETVTASSHADFDYTPLEPFLPPIIAANTAFKDCITEAAQTGANDAYLAKEACRKELLRHSRILFYQIDSYCNGQVDYIKLLGLKCQGDETGFEDAKNKKKKEGYPIPKKPLAFAAESTTTKGTIKLSGEIADPLVVSKISFERASDDGKHWIEIGEFFPKRGKKFSKIIERLESRTTLEVRAVCYNSDVKPGPPSSVVRVDVL